MLRSASSLGGVHERVFSPCPSLGLDSSRPCAHTPLSLALPGPDASSFCCHGPPAPAVQRLSLPQGALGMRFSTRVQHRPLCSKQELVAWASRARAMSDSSKSLETPGTLPSPGMDTRNARLNPSPPTQKPTLASCSPPHAWTGHRRGPLNGTAPLTRSGTYGLRGGFGFRRLHMQVGHHGLEALFVFSKLVGRKGLLFL